MAGRMVCLDDFERYASNHLAKNDLNYYKTGAEQEFTLQDNRAAFNRYRLQPRVLRNVSNIDLSTTILGHKISFPVGIAPSALHKLAHADGEIGTVKGAAAMNTVFTLSSYSSSTMEDVSESGRDAVKFFQMYIPRLRGKELTQSLTKAAERNGHKAIVLTVDRPDLGIRYENLRNNFRAPPHVKAELLYEALGGSVLNDVTAFETDVRITWDDVRWLKTITPLPIVVKGIMSPADAALAAECGVAAVWVSNHGGRQLDTVPATIDVLEPIVRAVAGRCEVYMDGGVRCGTDVLKALALGANAVFIGRPALYGLTYNGAAGVQQVLEIIKNELRVAMALTGITKISDIKREYVINEAEYKSKL